MYNSKTLIKSAAAAAFLLTIISCGGTPKDGPTANSPGLKLSQVGQSWQLQSVKYTNGSPGFNAATAGLTNTVTMTVSSDHEIIGKIFCNSFSATSYWEPDSHIYISNLRQETNVCPNNAPASPISFSPQMNFSFVSTSALTISDTAGTFSATFNLVQ
jgi:hypothetical protein